MKMQTEEFAEGCSAFAAGRRLRDNPYGRMTTGYRSYCWSEGWRFARRAALLERRARARDRSVAHG